MNSMKQGDLVAWRVDGRKMIIIEILTFADGSKQYKCGFVGQDNMPCSSNFIEQELEPYVEKKLGFS